MFGKDKYLLPMMLAGALRDNLAAIEAGVQCVLNSVDANGRPIIYWNPSCHSKEGYTSESMVHVHSVVSLVARRCTYTGL